MLIMLKRVADICAINHDPRQTPSMYFIIITFVYNSIALIKYILYYINIYAITWIILQRKTIEENLKLHHIF